MYRLSLLVRPAPDWWWWWWWAAAAAADSAHLSLLFIISFFFSFLPKRNGGSSLVGGRHQLEPLPEGVAQGLRQGVDVPQDDVEGEGELVHVGADLRQLARTLEDGNLDVQDGVLRPHTQPRGSLDATQSCCSLRSMCIYFYRNQQVCP